MRVSSQKCVAAVTGIFLIIILTGCPPSKYALTVQTSGQGTVALNPSGGSYNKGQQVTVTATPAAGWQFHHWEGALTGSTNPASITMDAAKTVKAVFQASQYALTVPVSGQGAVAMDPPGGTYASGAAVTLTATPTAGWKFDHWEGALTGSTNPAQVTMNANKTVTAVFTALAVDTFTLSVQVTGQGTVTLNPPGGSYSANQVVALTPVAAAGWEFHHWEGALTGSASSAQLIMDENKGATAVFVRTQYTLTVVPEGGGTVTLDPPGGTYPSGTVVTLTPHPNANARFEIWDSGLTGTKSPATLVMNENKFVQAFFMPRLHADLYPGNLCTVGSTLYFLANGLYSGRELWKSDGTFEGTRLVKDIGPGSGSPSIYFLSELNGTLYFFASCYGYGLWKSDGTEDGTVLVADLGDTFPALPPVKVSGKLYFSALSQEGGELWATDGTTAGTTLVKSFGSYAGANPNQLTDVGGILYFNNSPDTDVFTLWKSDGTEAGTVPIYSNRWLSEIANLNGRAYFYAGTETRDYLYTTDGTAGGTHSVAEFFFGPGDFATSGGLLYFAAEPLTLANTRVYVTNGSGVFLVDEGPYRVWDLIDLNGTLLFEALYDVNSVAHCGLFATNGSGATLLKSINPHLFYSVESYQVVVGNRMYFAAENSYGGLGLWKSDGTSAGTNLVSDINPTGAGPYFMTDVDGTLMFAAQDDAHGFQLWKSDGTLAGTVPVSCPVP